MAETLQVRFPRHRKPVWCGPRKSRVRNSLQNISANERCLKWGGPAAGVGKRPSASPDVRGCEGAPRRDRLTPMGDDLHGFASAGEDGDSGTPKGTGGRGK